MVSATAGAEGKLSVLAGGENIGQAGAVERTVEPRKSPALVGSARQHFDGRLNMCTRPGRKTPRGRPGGVEPTFLHAAMIHCNGCYREDGYDPGCPGCGHEAELTRVQEENNHLWAVFKTCHGCRHVVPGVMFGCPIQRHLNLSGHCNQYEATHG